MGSLLRFPRLPRAASDRDVAGTPLSDEALLAACAVGEIEALGALFDRFHEHVFRFLAHLSSTDSEDLDDLVQKTFLEAHRGAARFRGESGVRQWLFGIAVNVSRHHRRSSGRRRATLLALAETPHSRVIQPDDLAEQRELLESMRAAVAELPHDLRSAFVLCELEEMSGVEAARVLGVREGTLRRRLHDARKRLRAALEGGTA